MVKRLMRMGLIMTNVVGCCSLALSLTAPAIEKLAQASSLSYLDTGGRMESSPYFAASGLEPYVQLVEPKTQSGVTVFKDSNGLVVSFRGSATPKNFLTNLRFKLVPAIELCPSAPESGLVHEGFQEASTSLWSLLKPALLGIIDSNSESSFEEITFTGHSLGAATALLCAVKFTEDESFDELASPTVVTFGGPKLCNQVLAEHLANDVMSGSEIVHLVHDKDPILANNQQIWDQYGFQHVGFELDMESMEPIIYQDKNDKPELSPSPDIAWNILDHCMYAGVFMGPRIL